MIRNLLAIPLMAATLLPDGQRSELPEVIFQTDVGTIGIAVDVVHAPASGRHFIGLIQRGAYNGGSFYRVVNSANDNGSPKITIVQGGPSPNAGKLPTVRHETTAETGIVHREGTVSLARTRPGTASGDFFISIGRNAALDFGGLRNSDRQGFAAFGCVVSGMATVRRIFRMRNFRKRHEDGFAKGQILNNPVPILNAFVSGPSKFDSCAWSPSLRLQPLH